MERPILLKNIVDYNVNVFATLLYSISYKLPGVSNKLSFIYTHTTRWTISKSQFGCQYGKG
jgi:hypothetical protein